MKQRLKRPRDPIQLAKQIGDIATGQLQDVVEDGKKPEFVEAGRKGGVLGGKSRAIKLTQRERKQIAIKAAAARWKKRDPDTAAKTEPDPPELDPSESRS